MGQRIGSRVDARERSTEIAVRCGPARLGSVDSCRVELRLKGLCVAALSKGDRNGWSKRIH